MLEARGACRQQPGRFYFHQPKTTQAGMPVLLRFEDFLGLAACSSRPIVAVGSP